MLYTTLLTSFLLLSNSLVSALLSPKSHYVDKRWRTAKRTYFPAKAKNVKSFTTPTGVTIRYKEPGKAGVCETTPGVGSYSGYIDLAPDVHIFFWFFESRQNPAQDPLSIWLNGGPGSDSLIGLFQEQGACRVTADLKTVINPYAWNNVSNMLFLSQPVGTGFSYQKMANGSLAPYTLSFLNSSEAPPTGTWPSLVPIDKGTIDTTDLAAQAAWHILQGFLSGLPQLAGDINVKKDFNLWTESYGGHYGPAFFDYFYTQNQKIEKGEMKGYALNFNSLGIGNGIIDETIQAPQYPEFAMHNTYGIKAYNQTVYDYAKFALNMPNGCLDQIYFCKVSASIPGGYQNYSEGHRITNVAASNPSIDTACSEAQDMCRDNVEGVYYTFSGRGTYDIRHTADDPTPPTYYIKFLNQGWVQDAIGVSLNYTNANDDVYFAFQSTGDFIYPNFKADLERIIASGVRVSLYYGDADYICNWFGGQAVSLEVDYVHRKEFADAGYAPLMYGGKQYGEVREYGNFSFTRIYESGHEVPYYQPQAALAVFNRTLNHVDIATGTKKVTNKLGSNGPKSATHTNSYWALPTAHFAKYSSSLREHYATVDNEPPPSSLAASQATARAFRS